MKKSSRIITLVLMICLVLSMGSGAMAKENKVKETKIKTTKVTCTSAGKVNVSFASDVVYDKETVAVTITDEEGNVIPSKLTKQNKRLATVAVTGLIKGNSYTLTITGIKDAKAEEFGEITAKFTAKKIKTAIKPSKTTATKKAVIIKFKGKAAYKDIAVTVKDKDGNELAATIIKKTKSQIKIKVDGLKKGEKYSYTVSGIKLKKEKNFGSVSGTFKCK